MTSPRASSLSWFGSVLLLATIAVPVLAQEAKEAKEAKKLPKIEGSKSGQDPLFMFVQTAKRGTFTPAKAGSAGTHILTLEGVAPETVFFSDRPARIAGAVEVGKFLEGLGFGPEDPPNAAIVLSTPLSETQDVIVAELINPKYDVSAQRLTYEVLLLKDSTFGGLSHWKERSDPSLPAKFGHVSLFIDDCPDTQLTCFGIFQCAGKRCCRAGCGGVGQTIGTCWSWESFSCRPCRDYTYKCYEPGGPCDNRLPFCPTRQCSTSPTCM